VQPRGRMDLVADLAARQPLAVVMRLLGLPVEDLVRCGKWSRDISLIFAGRATVAAPTALQQAAASFFEVEDYFSGLIAARRARPRDDLLTALLQVEEAGDRLT